MAGKKQPKKRTNREIVNAIMDLNQRVQHSIEYTNHVDRVFGLFLDFTKKRDEFSKFIDKKVEEEKKKAKENEQKADEGADPKDLPADTADKGSGTAGVRKK
tara:strand:+ start:1885 stop:2190 length:306 start_codon:yes stop_codon:yes gene_type:complete